MRDQEDMVMVLDYKSVDMFVICHRSVFQQLTYYVQYLTDDNFTGQNHLQHCHFSSFNPLIIWQCTASALQIFYIIPNKKNLLIPKLTEWFLSIHFLTFEILESGLPANFHNYLLM